MQTKREIGKRTMLTKVISFLIAVVYLVHPLHEQIGSIAHAVAHSIHTTQNVLEHETFSDDSKHGFDHGHHGISNIHEHEILDLFNAVFDAASEPEDNKGNSILGKKVLDKHFIDFDNTISLILDMDMFLDFNNTSQILLEGYHFTYHPPPQNL